MFKKNYEKLAKEYAYNNLLHELYLLKQIVSSDFLTQDAAKKNEINGVLRNIEQSINLLTLNRR